MCFHLYHNLFPCQIYDDSLNLTKYFSLSQVLSLSRVLSLAKIDRVGIMMNSPENKTDLKFEDQLSTDDSILGDASLEERNIEEPLKSKIMLPLKKRFGENLANSNLNLTKAPCEYSNPWIKIKQEDKKMVKPEPKKAKILPGVIRHTSCPDNTLAYYYNYNIQ